MDDIDKALDLLEPVRHLALLLGLGTTEWRTAERACAEAPDVRTYRTGDRVAGSAGYQPSGPFHPYQQGGSSASGRLVVLTRKGITEQRRVADNPAEWRLTPYGLNVLQRALAVGRLPDMPEGWTPSDIHFAELQIPAEPTKPTKER